MMRHVTETSRTFSTSSTVREVIQANGHSGSNQKSTLLTSTDNRARREVFRAPLGTSRNQPKSEPSGPGPDQVTTAPRGRRRVGAVTPRVAGSAHAWNQPH